jgi:hypothetical protein
LQHQPAAAQADQAADAELAQQVHQQAPVQAGLAAGEHVDQGHGEEHRHRVVAAGFDFQAGGDPFVQPLPPSSENTAAASVEPTMAPISKP